MGEAGLITRVFAGRFGSAWTYAGNSASAAIRSTQMSCSTTTDFDRLVPETALYGLVGSPIEHSVSPAMHNAAFAATGRNAVYLPFPCRRCRRLRHVCPRRRREGRERDDSIQSLAARSRRRCRSACSRDRRPEHDSNGRETDGRVATRTPTAFCGRSTIEASRWPAVARRFSAPADRHGRSPWRWRHGKRR